jgi:putative PEP-CTERM system TPR-repeat lipoprotein
LRGRARLELGDLDLATQDFEHAATLAQERVEPLLGQAMVAAARSRYEQAQDLLERAIKLAPGNVEARFRKGEVQRERGDDAGALTTYAEALKLDPKALRVRLARAGVNFKLGEREAALADVEFVRRRSPQDLGAAFLRWQIYQQARDGGAEAALAEVSGKLSQYADETIASEPLLLRIAALVHYANHDLTRADKYLARYVELRPNDTAMQRMHGEALLALGEAKEAISVLIPLSHQEPDNLDILRALGQAYLQTGHYGEAESVFAQALKVAPSDHAVLNALALARIGLGNVDGAQTGLAEAIANDSAGRGAQMLLTVLQLRSGKRQQALATIEAEAKREPRDQRVLNLLGVVRASNDDEAGARQAFGAALDIAPDFAPAVYNLARLERAAGDTGAARSRLQALVERNPNAAAALVALAEMALAANDRAGAARWLEKAVTAQPDAVDAEAQLVTLKLALGQRAEALATASHMVERHPENALAVESLAEAQAANQNNDQALRHFRDAARYAGFDGAQLMRIATRQVELEDYAEARRTLQKAINSSASDEARDALIRLEIKLGEYDYAQNRIAALREDKANEALADIMTAELELRREDAPAAIKAYRAAQASAPSTLAVLGLADALVANHDAPAAARELELWTAKHADDLDASHALALLYLRLQRLDEARKLHERLLEVTPEDPSLLANLARLYQLGGDQRARATAEQALKLAPESALAQDTLGWIIVTQGDAKGGLELLRNALSRDGNPLIRYHLAQALNELGRDAEARSELRKILRSGQPPELIADVQRYYDALPAQ